MLNLARCVSRPIPAAWDRMISSSDFPESEHISEQKVDIGDQWQHHCQTLLTVRSWQPASSSQKTASSGKAKPVL